MELKRSVQAAKASATPVTPSNQSIPHTNGKTVDPKKVIFDSDDEKASQITPDSKLKEAGSNL